MPIAMTDTQRALVESIQDWGTRSGLIDAVRSGTAITVADARWSGLADIGVFGIAVPQELGGAGGTVADAAAALEATASVLAPGPVLPTLLAATLLARHPDSAPAKELVPGLAAGSVSAGVVVAPGTAVGRFADDGALRVEGEAGLVLGADERAHLLLSARVQDEQRWFVLAPGHPGVRVDPADPLDFSRPLGTVVLEDVLVPPTAVVPALSTRMVDDLLVTMAAAEASGVADWAVRTAADYAKVREQFGRRIGSFQAVKQVCAEMLCRAEQACAVAWDAACAAEEDAEQHAFAAAVAGSLALDAAVDNAKDCIQVLGGIGFTWEHDAHLYLRRAVALRQLLGGAARLRRSAARLALTGSRRRRAEPDLAEYGNEGAEAERAREGVRAEAEAIAALPAGQRRARLVKTGYLMPHWPPPHGMSASPALQLVIDAELERAGITRPGLVIGAWAAPTILEHGTPEQAERFVGPTLRGEIAWCQLFSEPEAGSDLASLRTKAVRADGGWLLTGQKVWTSLAREADWAICLARTDPEVPKHKGITYFLVDMRSAGIETRPLREITGDERFNEVFLTDVFVPDDCVVGAVNGGWRLARTTLANERVAMSGGSTLGEGVERLLELFRDAQDQPVETLGRLVAEGTACSVLDLRSVVRSLGGQDPGAESSVRKLIGVRHRQEVAEAALELLGPEGAVSNEADGAVAGVQYEFLLSRCLSIAGGTTQVLLSVAAERLLGLPRG